MSTNEWFLLRRERGNWASTVDDGGAQEAWSVGNLVVPLIHGATYFASLKSAVEQMRCGDLLLFVDWRGDPDELLTDSPGSEVARVLCMAASRGVDVRGLVWRSHWDRLRFSAAENRHLDEQIAAAGGQCLLDMRVRAGGSHHQKFVVLRHRGHPQDDVAFLGGIDLCHSRRDDASHAGDRQAQPMAAAYGDRPPWHDVQLQIRGPAVGVVERVFRERWDDAQPLSRNPVHTLADRVRGDDRTRRRLPSQLPDPPSTGPHTVQLLRTYPNRIGGYPFAPDGERSIARGYIKALQQARQLIYIEDQYLWSRDVARYISDALRTHPQLHLLAVLPHFPDQDGRLSMPPNLIGRTDALQLIESAGQERVACYGLENPTGTPVYVHAKVCVIDDVWVAVGSDNFNRRSWSHDSELTAAILDETVDGRHADHTAEIDQPRAFARNLRLALAREHLDRGIGDDADLVDPYSAFRAFAASAAALERWYLSGRAGPRPPGRLRPLTDQRLNKLTRLWAEPLYRRIYDPDGRPRRLRRTNEY